MRCNEEETNGTAANPLQTGWEQLAQGRWAPAAAAFVAALEQEKTPEAFEGLSWAAWWQDDAATLFQARERAFRLYRRHGQVASAARMAIWLAADELDFNGAFAVTRGWLRRARRLLEPLQQGPEHGWLAFHEGYIAHGQGDTTRALALAAAAAGLGRELEVPDLEMLGLALRGAVLVACAEVEEGMGCLDEATTMALEDEAAIPISGAWACCFLVSACEAVRDYPRAFEWCDRIAEFAQRYGSRYMLGFCRAHYGAVHLWRGDWEDAEKQLESAIEAYGGSRPAFVGGAIAQLAELRRRQGKWDEADRLLEQAAGGSGLLCRARLALDRNDTWQAVQLTERVLRRVPQHRRLERAPALELQVLARARRGEVAEAAATLEELEEIERRVGTLPLRAAVRLEEGIVAAASGDHDRARRRLEDAVDLFERSGAPFEAAEARIELAESLLALGRREAAEGEARTALGSLGRLGAGAEARRARRLLDASVDAGAPPPELTRRQREVLRLVADGLTNRQIAERLVISEHTVHRHISSILRRLDVPSRAAAAARAVGSGLLPPSSE